MITNSVLVEKIQTFIDIYKIIFYYLSKNVVNIHMKERLISITCKKEKKVFNK